MARVTSRLVLTGALFAAVALACSSDAGTAPESTGVSAVEIRFPHDSLFLGRTVHATAVATGDSVSARIGPLASSPYHIRTGVKFVALSYTAHGPCGITSDGRALCW